VIIWGPNAPIARTPKKFVLLIYLGSQTDPSLEPASLWSTGVCRRVPWISSKHVASCAIPNQTDWRSSLSRERPKRARSRPRPGAGALPLSAARGEPRSEVCSLCRGGGIVPRETVPSEPLGPGHSAGGTRRHELFAAPSDLGRRCRWADNRIIQTGLSSRRLLSPHAGR
jgi:hypothetical protein